MITSYKLLDKLLDNFDNLGVELTLSSKLVLLFLIKCYNPKHDSVFPKQKTMAKRLDINKNSVSRAIKELEEKALIFIKRKYSNIYKINTKVLFNALKFEDKKSPNLGLEDLNLGTANITDKEYIKEQQVKKNFSSNDSAAVKKTKELIRSYKDSELKSDYQDLNREEAIIYLGKCVPRTMFKKSTIAKYLMDKFSITIDEIPKREELDGELGK